MIPDFFGSGWIMRIYHDADGGERLDFMCNVSCHHPHVDLCYAGDIPQLGNLTGLNRLPSCMRVASVPASGVSFKIDVEPTVWRYLPLADPLVQEFHSRDLDSRPSMREMDAVREFQESPAATFHIMRDHKQHRAPILGKANGPKRKTCLSFK